MFVVYPYSFRYNTIRQIVFSCDTHITNSIRNYPPIWQVHQAKCEILLLLFCTHRQAINGNDMHPFPSTVLALLFACEWHRFIVHNVNRKPKCLVIFAATGLCYWQIFHVLVIWATSIMQNAKMYGKWIFTLKFCTHQFGFVFFFFYYYASILLWWVISNL